MTTEEIFILKNGNKIFFREVTPDDKAYFIEGIKNLSQESIQHRFFIAKKGFSEEDLKRLTDFDKNTHFAICAVNYPEKNEGLAVGRFNIDTEDTTRAEFGILVIDKFHGNGLGRILLNQLIRHAKSKNISTLYGQLKSTNQAMINLANSLDVHVKIIQEGQGILRLVLTF